MQCLLKVACHSQGVHGRAHLQLGRHQPAHDGGEKKKNTGIRAKQRAAIALHVHQLVYIVMKIRPVSVTLSQLMLHWHKHSIIYTCSGAEMICGERFKQLP